MDSPAFSIVIPYKQRLDNLRLVFASLAEQTMDRDRFEIVVGAMEYDSGYLSLCQEYAERLSIVSVMVDRRWNTSHARNIALRQATGRTLVLLDADVALPPGCLQWLQDRYFATGPASCVLGQLIGYDNYATTEAVDASPFSRHRAALAELDTTRGLRQDQRWQFEPVRLPWTLVWTGFVAVPADLVRRHDLYFDENFEGWGAEDQEWGYRLAATGAPIVRGDDLYGLHLPHVRDAERNFATFDANKGYFLARWPSLDVELFRASDSWVANREILALRAAVSRALDGDGDALGVVRGTAGGVDVLVVGVALDERSGTHDPEVELLRDSGFPYRTLPLAGLALPFADGEVSECRILPRIMRLDDRYRDMVLSEATRVARRVALPETANP